MTPVLNKPEPLHGQTLPIPGKSPWDCLMEIREEIAGRPLVVWESPGGMELAGVGEGCRVEVSGPRRFVEARDRLDAILDSAADPAVAVGGFSFGEQEKAPGSPGFPDALFLVPERMFARARPEESTRETRWSGGSAAVPPVSPALPPNEVSSWDLPAWTDAVRRTLDRIREGALSKAVLARSLVIPLGRARGALEILATLREMYPTCYRFLIDDGRGRAFVGASPERLVSVKGEEFHTEAVAGTQRCDAGDDVEAMERALRSRVKDQREHEVVLRHILDAVAPISREVHTAPAEVMRLPHLLHLRTRVWGLRRRTHLFDYVSALHPTPAVAGWPRAEALDWIGSVEPSPRGWYAGCVGWVDRSRDGDFAVGIRSAAIRGDRASVVAGAGIVEGSDPEQEWNETELKMKGILDAIARD